MTPLADLLARRIAATGPITLADYMAECLLHPEHGYYTRGTGIGAAGDFTTAPEISQMFGELVCLALAQTWLDQGCPEPVALVELGPGRGTLMADMLRALRAVPPLAAAVEVHLVEASPALREVQAKALAPMLTARPPVWHDGVDTLPERATLLVANEFLDALPVRQFTRAGAGWRETVVGLDGASALMLGLSQAAPLALLDHRRADTAEGTVVEHCPALAPVVQAVARRIAAHGGAGLFIDYGGWRSRGDTVQAVRRHRPVGVLEAPGECDLTAHVDFEAVARAAAEAGARSGAMTEQGIWLERLGIAARAQLLAQGLPEGPARDAHLAAYRRLTAPEEMGSVFKVIGIGPANGAVPPGLES